MERRIWIKISCAVTLVLLLVLAWMIVEAEPLPDEVVREEVAIAFVTSMLTCEPPGEDRAGLFPLISSGVSVAEARLASVIAQYSPLMTAEGLERAMNNRLFDEVLWYCRESDCAVSPRDILLEPRQMSIAQMPQYNVSAVLVIIDAGGELVREEPTTGMITMMKEEGAWKVHFAAFSLKDVLSR